MNINEKEIWQALVSLGYNEDIIFVCLELNKNREAVFIDGEIIGIYDFIRHTFVD